MASLVHELLFRGADRAPAGEALSYQGTRVDYASLSRAVREFSAALLWWKIRRGERVAVYLEKRLETVTALFGAAAAGAVFVPINPLLKPEQVAHILKDCNVRVLVTSPVRLDLLATVLAACPDLHT